MKPGPVLLLSLVCLTAGRASARTIQSFDLDWRFLRGDAAGAEQRCFADSGWRKLDVPHDWSIEGPFAETNRTGWFGGYLPAGPCWYRKQFTLPAHAAGQRVSVEFDGVMANSDVWLNGHLLGHRPYGYSSFAYDLSEHARFGPGETNILAVRADTSAQPASRWYTGAGIYRHVRLVTCDPVHVAHWGCFVTTPEVSPKRALVRLQTTVENQSAAPQEVQLQTLLVSPRGKVTKSGATTRSIPAGGSAEFQQDVAVDSPCLWDLEHPQLYRARSLVRVAGKLVDESEVPFGIREARFEPATGFWLNGRNLKLKGVCLHHDGGAVGAAVPLRLWERRLELLKSIGCNALRTSHNPVAPEFLDLADRMGFLVMDEAFDAWTRSKVAFDYGQFFHDWWQADLGDMIRRDRNHPSIVIYSAGNEIHDVLYDPPLGLAVFQPMPALCHALDPTRPVTVAVNQPQRSRIHDTGFADLMDVAGYNYAEAHALEGRLARPDRKIIGTENAKSPAAWRAVRDHPDLPGLFCWTGFDYFGESVRRWPYVSFEMGMFDRTGAPRPVAWQFQTFWTDRPAVYAARKVKQPPLPGGTKIPPAPVADWNPGTPPGETLELEIYSNCPQIELLLNGASLGTYPMPSDCSPLTLPVAYRPGVLSVVGRRQGRRLCEFALRTAGAPQRLRLETDRPAFTTDREDLCHVTACLVDEHGTVVPSAAQRVTFSVSGPARILAVDNGALDSHELFQTHTRAAFRGRCVALVQSTGKPGRIQVRASAPDLPEQAVEIVARRVDAPEAYRARHE